MNLTFCSYIQIVYWKLVYCKFIALFIARHLLRLDGSEKADDVQVRGRTGSRTTEPRSTKGEVAGATTVTTSAPRRPVPALIQVRILAALR